MEAQNQRFLVRERSLWKAVCPWLLLWAHSLYWQGRNCTPKEWNPLGYIPRVRCIHTSPGTHRLSTSGSPSSQHYCYVTFPYSVWYWIGFEPSIPHPLVPQMGAAEQTSRQECSMQSLLHDPINNSFKKPQRYLCICKHMHIWIYIVCININTWIKWNFPVIFWTYYMQELLLVGRAEIHIHIFLQIMVDLGSIPSDW